MKVDPYVWIVTLPLAVAAVQLYFQPPDHVLKRLWRRAVEMEMFAWRRFGWQVPPRWAMLHEHQLGRRASFVLMIMALAVCSLVSLAAFVGVVPAS
ncbi:MAG: hypothetical protein L0Y44_14985 [Phycisphaerales bacterium]|nr:hypothetical protein [Phycisphaerales bacterium]MCI0631947.1 hypothetical protein [Phycisphaerales bacterium]